jgi:hypothetical protein
MTAGANPLFAWKEPLRVCAHMKVTLQDYYALPENKKSLQTILFRAAGKFQGVPAQDCIKVLVETDGDASSIYFAQCLANVQDGNDDFFCHSTLVRTCRRTRF